MGLECKHTTITIDGQAHDGDALLETDEVFVRIAGEPKRRKLPLSALKKVRGEGTTLSFEHARVRYAIEVRDAAKWVKKITSPATLLDKLGIAKSSRAHIAGLDDDHAFEKMLETAKIERVALGKDASVVVIGITTRAQLSIVKKARRAVGDGLALWIAYPKVRKEPSKDLDRSARQAGPTQLRRVRVADHFDRDVRAAAIAEGLVDVKVARFSDERSALKLVVRKSERGK